MLPSGACNAAAQAKETDTKGPRARPCAILALSARAILSDGYKRASRWAHAHIPMQAKTGWGLGSPPGTGLSPMRGVVVQNSKEARLTSSYIQQRWHQRARQPKGSGCSTCTARPPVTMVQLMDGDSKGSQFSQSDTGQPLDKLCLEVKAVN